MMEVRVARSAQIKLEDRTPRRSRVLMTAVLYTPDGARNVRVQDLSAKGARILCDGPVADGCDALFKRGGVFAAARVVWASAGKAGLSFYRELSGPELDSAFNSVVAGACATTRSEAPRPLQPEVG